MKAAGGGGRNVGVVMANGVIGMAIIWHLFSHLRRSALESRNGAGASAAKQRRNMANKRKLVAALSAGVA